MSRAFFGEIDGAGFDPIAPAFADCYVGHARVESGEVFATCNAGLFDGFRLDTYGRLCSSTGEGVHCFAPDGTLIGRILVPEIVANVTFGGAKRNRLFICATTSLYAVYLTANGCTPG